MKWISRQNRNYWFWFCVLTWFQILAAVLSAWISCPLLAAFSGFPTWGSWPGIPCRRSFGFQGSIDVLLVAYHTFKRIFRTWQVRFCVDFILNSLENRTSCPVRKISIPYPFAAEQEVFVPVLRSFFGFYGQKPEALVPANHWIAFIIAEISLNF